MYAVESKGVVSQLSLAVGLGLFALAGGCATTPDGHPEPGASETVPTAARSVSPALERAGERIASRLEARTDALYRCYQDHRDTVAPVPGGIAPVHLTVVLDTGGQLVSTTVRGVRSDDFADCLEDAIAASEFGGLDLEESTALSGTIGFRTGAEKLEIFAFKPTGDGELSPATIRAQIATVSPDIQACYKEALRERPDLEGTVKVRIEIGEGGEVASTAIVESTLGTRSVETCILRSVSGLTFPAPPGDGSVKIRYPFAFAPP